MMIFWWTGKGWKPALILMLTLVATRIVQIVMRDFIGDPHWLWALAFLVAAAITWKLCSHDNRKATSRKMSPNLKNRLLYKPRNRFMSLPSETWAVPFAALALWYFVLQFAA